MARVPLSTLSPANGYNIPMKRVLFNLAVFLSTVLLLANVVYLFTDRYALYSMHFWTRTCDLSLTVAERRVAFEFASRDNSASGLRWTHSDVQVEKTPPGIFLDARVDDGPSLIHKCAGVRVYTNGLSYRCIAAPAWYPVPLWAILPALYLLRLCRRLRNRRIGGANLCPTCSYDLRAHNSGQKCPECGTPIPAAAGLAQP